MNIQENTLSNTSAQKTFTLSQPRLLLALEGLSLFVGSILIYAYLGGGWLPFIALLLVPDVSMVGYLVNKQLGATVYNIVHTISLPLALGLTGLALNEVNIMLIASIWMAHIGMDRTAGYGLKYAVSFKETHLNRV